MAGKITKQASAAHTAGIYADKTVDGPEIGTLVAIFDRAKNLPNRKTMGKQDPYCAARLGKEAKKTETDKRGGQTPRWDQELRFVVRDSPDYYQLKVSCFSEDKKTDLISETWIDLKSVIVPGGGQSDLWHSLQFKGKYAGDIRIELTYYDTRPKDESVVEKRRESERNDTNGSPSNSLSGPRQPKQVKRRPLPADPTGSSPLLPRMPDQVHSSPMPSTRSYENLSGQDTGYPQHMPHAPPNSSYPNRHLPNPIPQESPLGTYDEIVAGQMEDECPPENQDPIYGDYKPQGGDYYGQEAGFERHSYGPDRFNREDRDELPVQDPYQTPLREDWRFSAEPSFPPQTIIPANNTPPLSYGSSPEYPQQRSAPGSGGRTERQYQPYNRYSTSPLKSDVFRDSPLRHSISHYQEDTIRYMQPSVEDEDPPPPPPAHRNVTTPQTSDARSYNEGPREPILAPLNVMPDRKSPRPFGGPERTLNVAASEQITTISPTSDYSRSSFPTNSSHSTGARGMSRDCFQEPFNINEAGPNHPPTLTPGFDPVVAASESERTTYETHQSRRYSNIPPQAPIPQNRSDPAYGIIQPHSPYISPSPTAERPLYGGPAPITKPRASSPAARATPPRKSVSPQPAPPSDERRLSGVPFGPDSYDTFNPNAAKAASVHQIPFFETPDQAKAAARQLEVEKLRAVGPIISNDGRVIDPSDHLPADTWAPEPERKGPKKPEVVIRFKNTGVRPQPSSISARPSPGTPNSAPRPHSIASVPIYAHSQSTPSPFNMSHGSSFPNLDSTSPTASQQARQGRNRLQKSNPQSQPQHPYSSPAIPTLHQQTPNRPRPSDYPLRENENYNPPPRHARPDSYHSSPISTPKYSSSPYTPSSAPPIPAKIPIQMGNQNYAAYGNGMDALSREMSSIDIGASSGSRGGRRMQRGGGYQFREV